MHYRVLLSYYRLHGLKLVVALGLIIIFFNFRYHYSLDEGDLIQLIKTRHLTPPSLKSVPYHLVNPSGLVNNESYHLSILKILSKLGRAKNGLFVECGALDGEAFSHTLDLEMHYGWSGLLIEGSPNKVSVLRKKRRKAWIVDCCLSGEPYRKVEFLIKSDETEEWQRGNGMIKPEHDSDLPVEFEGLQNYKSEGEVECFSLYLVLRAAGVTEVDLFVLDVEGQEYEILKSYPFHLIPIKVIAVEHWLTKHRKEMVELLVTNGYEMVYSTVSDYIFVWKGS